MYKPRVVPLLSQLPQHCRHSCSGAYPYALIPVVVPETWPAFSASRKLSLFRDWTYTLKIKSVSFTKSGHKGKRTQHSFICVYIRLLLKYGRPYRFPCDPDAQNIFAVFVLRLAAMDIALGAQARRRTVFLLFYIIKEML